MPKNLFNVEHLEYPKDLGCIEEVTYVSGYWQEAHMVSAISALLITVYKSFSFLSTQTAEPLCSLSCNGGKQVKDWASLQYQIFLSRKKKTTKMLQIGEKSRKERWGKRS